MLDHHTIHRDQRKTHSRTWGASSGGCCAPIPVHCGQALQRESTTRFRLLYSTTPDSRRVLVATGTRHLIRTAGGGCIHDQRRTAGRGGLLPRTRSAVDKFVRAVMAARCLSVHEHSACKLSDALECHSKTPLSQVGFNTNQYERRAFADVQIEVSRGNYV